MKDKQALFSISIFFVLMMFAFSLPVFSVTNPGENTPIEEHAFHVHTKGNISGRDGVTNSEAVYDHQDEDDAAIAQ